MSNPKGALCAHEQRLLVERFAEQLAPVNTPADFLVCCGRAHLASLQARTVTVRRRRYGRWFLLGTLLGMAAFQALALI